MEVSVRLGQIGILHWRIKLVGTRPGGAKLTVLPNDVAALIDEQYAIIGAPLVAMGDGCRWHADARHECQRAHALSVVRANNRVRVCITGTKSELPNDPAGSISITRLLNWSALFMVTPSIVTRAV